MKILRKNRSLRCYAGVEVYEDRKILGIMCVQSIAMPYDMSVSVCKCINVSEYRCREKKKNFPIGDVPDRR